MVELERTFLVKEIPSDLKDAANKEMIDIYYPKESEHPVLRLRKNGEKYEMTKKEPAKEGDASTMIEQTIKLTPEEYAALSQLPGKKVHKIRYAYTYNGHEGEIDIFQGDLAGLVLADFEFTTEEDKEAFTMPDFCLAEITQEQFTAGGMICGKTYADIADKLKEFGYVKLVVS